MGGHGYLQVNEITEILEMVAPNVTLEGDGCVMHQQTARDIFKSLGKLMVGKEVSENYSYLGEFGNYMGEKLQGDFKEIDTLIEIIKVNSIFQALKVGEDLRK